MVLKGQGAEGLMEDAQASQAHHFQHEPSPDLRLVDDILPSCPDTSVKEPTTPSTPDSPQPHSSSAPQTSLDPKLSSDLEAPPDLEARVLKASEGRTASDPLPDSSPPPQCPSPATPELLALSDPAISGDSGPHLLFPKTPSVSMKKLPPADPDSPCPSASSNYQALSSRGLRESSFVDENPRLTPVSNNCNCAQNRSPGTAITDKDQTMGMLESVLPAIELLNVTPGHVIDELLKNLSIAIGTASFSSVVYTSRPVTMILALTPIRVLFGILSLYALWISYIQIVESVSDSSWTVTSRLCKIELEDSVVGFKGVRGIGLMENRWPIDSRILPGGVDALSSVWERSEIVLETNSTPPTWNGIYFQIDSREIDDVAITVHSFDSEHANWTKVATISRATNPYSSRDVISYDLRHSVQVGMLWFHWAPAAIWESMTWCVCFGICGMFGRRTTVAKMAWTLLVCTTLCVGSRLLYVRFSTEGAVFYVVAQLAVYLSLISVTVSVWREKWVKSTFAGTCFSLSVLSVAVTRPHSEGEGMGALGAILFAVFLAFIPLMLILVISVLRRRNSSHASTLIQEDRLKYEQAFRQLIAQEMNSIMSLKRKVDETLRSSGESTIRQYHRLKAVNEPSSLEDQSYRILENDAASQFCGISGIDRRTIPGSIDLQNPVQELSVLFNHARIAHVLLRHKCQQWALQCSGKFRTRDPKQYTLWSSAVEDRACRAQILWPEVKNPKRTVEKNARLYAGDVSRVVDIARQEIIFETISDLERCFDLVSADNEVEIVRAKNKLDVHFFRDEHGSGFRNLHINMRIISQAAMSLGVETHICELQCIPEVIAHIKTQEGHRRYVNFRNLMGT